MAVQQNRKTRSKRDMRRAPCDGQRGRLLVAKQSRFERKLQRDCAGQAGKRRLAKAKDSVIVLKHG